MQSYICIVCGSEFQCLPRELGRTMTCGRACAHASKTKSLVGQRFGKLEVIADAGYRFMGDPNRPNKRQAQSLCKCECGKQLIIPNTSLLRGNSETCGCYRITHGHTVGGNSRTYQTWLSMIARCYNPHLRGYKFWGGRGITVCDEWRNDFLAFLAHVGERPAGKSIDRIDNNRGYEPGNVRWATMIEQQRNRRSNIIVTFEGVTCTVTEHCQRLGVPKARIFKRVENGWTYQDALSTPRQGKQSLPSI